MLVYIFKPLATILILALALSLRSSSARYKRAIIVGLLCSLAGDIFLMLPGDLFLQGLISFLLAHVCYLIAFTVDAPLMSRKLPYLAFALLAGVVLVFLWPGVPAALRIPVIIYVALLATMAAQAAVRWRLHPSRETAYAALGGALFVASDAMLACNRFGFPFAASTAMILATYYAAQFLIAKSV